MDPSKITLKDINDIESDEISDQIAVRRHLIKQLSGNVYPNILYGEIQALVKRQEMKIKSEQDLIERQKMRSKSEDRD